jgi:hypothetical protein
VSPRPLRRAAWALAFAAGSLLAAPARPAGAAGAGPLRVTLAFTGDVSGYLEPCG